MVLGRVGFADRPSLWFKSLSLIPKKLHINQFTY